MNVITRNLLLVIASCCITVGLQAKNDKSEKKESIKKVLSKDLDKTCDDIATSFLKSKGFDAGLLPKHCKKEYKQKLDSLLIGLKHEMKINKKRSFDVENIEYAIAVTLKDFVDYLDTITYRGNLEKKVTENMYKKCAQEGVEMDGLYEGLAEIFENKKNEVCYTLFNVLSRNICSDTHIRDLCYQLKKDRGVKTESPENIDLYNRYTSDYFTQKDLDEILQEEMRMFLMFAQNTMVSMWWQELMKHIEEPVPGKAYAQTKIPLVADKRSLLTPPSFVYDKK